MSIVDICNRALSEMGTQSVISSLNEGSPEATQCSLWYDNIRKGLLRTAPWGFARKTSALTLLGSYADSTSPFPFLYKYAYPSDCIKFRYLFPTPIINGVDAVVVGDLAPGYAFCGPSRTNRFLVSLEANEDELQTRVIVSNVRDAIGVYTTNVTSPDVFDDLFEDALTSALSYKLVIPLSGNVGMKDSFGKAANDAVLQARVADGNEAIPTSDHTVDWIAARGVGSPFGYGPGYGGEWGSWYDGYDNSSWGM